MNDEENRNRGGWREPSEQDPDVTAVKGGKAGRRTGQEELQPGRWGDESRGGDRCQARMARCSDWLGAA